MARKKKHEEHENHERWLVSYADFITLLFAFFVVMYAVSSVNEGKYRVLSESLVAAFRSPTKSLLPIQVGSVAKSPYQDQIDFRKSPAAVELPNLPVPRVEPDEPGRDLDVAGKGSGQEHSGDQGADVDPVQLEIERAEQALATISGEIERAMADMIEKGLIKVRRSQHWVEVEINTSILFPSGSATLSPGAREILEQLAGILKKFPNAIHVEGFTDSVPINNVIFPSNWELSAGRAASVVHLFTESGVEPQRLVAIGYGQYRPVADNDTPEGRAKNRRVVLVIQSTADTGMLAQALAEYERMHSAADRGAGDQAEPLAAAHAAALQAARPKGQTPVVHRSVNAGALRAPGKFPVITPPIQLPFEGVARSPIPEVVP